ncbi:MAG TPA: GldG family protein [Acetivibrio sp.]|nr:GldG family protein [Clostridium sp.]HOQ37978.1 GldG family protein [Acetivibrio sp.]HPT91714.1 GldG family protein [Acetivibrio sp.]HQA56364.1 GldG family protein [Acetivibrio sp.]
MMKNVKYGFLFLIMAVLVIGITIFVNVLAATVDLSWDMTTNKLYSIGEQTESILESLQKEVEIVMLGDKEEIKGEEAGFILVQFFDNYDKFDKVKVSYVDPDKNPNFVTKLDESGVLALSEYDIVVKCGTKAKKLTLYDIFQSDNYGLMMFYGEQAVTGAIKYVTSDITPTVYFVDSNAGRKLDSQYTIVKRSLQNNNFDVMKINLTAADKIPDDCTVLIFTAPNKDLSYQEKNKVSEYLKNGGNAVFLFDPIDSPEKFKNFDSLLEEYTIALNYDRVKENDPQRHVANRPYDIVPTVEACDVTNSQDLSQFFVIMPSSTSFRRLLNEKEPLTVLPLLTTSDMAVGEPYGGGVSEEVTGPVDIGLIAEYQGAKTTKVAVIGNAYFVSDEAIAYYYPDSYNALRLITLTVDWMYDKSNDVFVLPKSANLDSVILTGLNANLIVIVTVIAFPILIVAAGIIIWLRRRHL